MGSTLCAYMEDKSDCEHAIVGSEGKVWCDKYDSTLSRCAVVDCDKKN